VVSLGRPGREARDDQAARAPPRRALARRLGPHAVVFSLGDVPSRQWLVARRYRLPLATRAAREADGVAVASEVARDAFRRYLLREPAIVAPGDAASFEALYASAGER
jgi:hypothetical protein